MPRQWRKNLRKRRRKKSYGSRLADKKINTLIEKRMSEIAKKEDRKAIVKYVHWTPFAVPTLTWTDAQTLPITSTWKQIVGGQIYTECLSDFSGHIRFPQLEQQDNAERQTAEIRIHGLESRFKARNISDEPVRLEVRLVYVPNLNQNTTAGTDRLNPDRIEQYFRSHSGAGSMRYFGCNRLSTFSQSTGDIPTTIHTLDRKVMYLPSSGISGTQTQQFGDGSGSAVSSILMTEPVKYKRFSLSKWFKRPRKNFTGSPVGATDGDYLRLGNYFLVVWSDCTADGNAKLQVLGSNNLQYSLKRPVFQDD